MPLKDVGEAKLSKSKKSIHIDYEPFGDVFSHHLFISVVGLERVLAGKQASVKVVVPVHGSRVGEKFDA